MIVWWCCCQEVLHPSNLRPVIAVGVLALACAALLVYAGVATAADLRALRMQSFCKTERFEKHVSLCAPPDDVRRAASTRFTRTDRNAGNHDGDSGDDEAVALLGEEIFTTPDLARAACVAPEPQPAPRLPHPVVDSKAAKLQKDRATRREKHRASEDAEGPPRSRLQLALQHNSVAVEDRPSLKPPAPILVVNCADAAMHKGVPWQLYQQVKGVFLQLMSQQHLVFSIFAARGESLAMLTLAQRVLVLICLVATSMWVCAMLLGRRPDGAQVGCSWRPRSGCGRWAVGGGRWAVSGERWAVSGGRWAVGGGLGGGGEESQGRGCRGGGK